MPQKRDNSDRGTVWTKRMRRRGLSEIHDVEKYGV